MQLQHASTLPTVDDDAEKKKVRFAQNYTKQQIVDVWKRFFTVLCGQLTESFEFERQKCLNAENQRTLAPHQKAEEAQRKKRQNAEKQSEGETATTITNGRDTEEMFEDPF
ncbi:CRE-GLB-12 protein [Aphelenchoides avenae]|nr:CRE-GLB-12 protein [Aphelenchus avenae]